MPLQKRARHKKLEAPQDGILLHSCRELLDSKERHGEVDGCIFIGASYLSFQTNYSCATLSIIGTIKLLYEHNFYKETLDRE
jgi:hypothetical protein